MGDSQGRDRLVAAIGVFKLVKAAILAPLGVAALLGVPADMVRSVVHRLSWTGALSGHHLVHAMFERTLALTDHGLRQIGAACLAYAAGVVVEGVGLMKRARWAGWLARIGAAFAIP